MKVSSKTKHVVLFAMLPVINGLHTKKHSLGCLQLFDYNYSELS